MLIERFRKLEAFPLIVLKTIFVLRYFVWVNHPCHSRPPSLSFPPSLLVIPAGSQRESSVFYLLANSHIAFTSISRTVGQVSIHHKPPGCFSQRKRSNTLDSGNPICTHLDIVGNITYILKISGQHIRWNFLPCNQAHNPDTYYQVPSDVDFATAKLSSDGS